MRNAIVEGGLFVEEKGDIFKNGGFDRILNRLEQTIAHLNRVQDKNMNEILVFQNKLLNEKAA
ncbi:MAG: hypothetical protein ACFHU9_05990 [Fluviicola sp.]